MRKLITVTEDDIKNGKPYDFEGCPVALAVKREFPKRKVRVMGLSGVYVGRTVTPHAKRTKKFIHEFDDSGHVEPFSFYVKVPNA